MISSGMAWIRLVVRAISWSAALLLATLLAVPSVHAADYQLAPQPKWVVQRVLDVSAQPAAGQALDGVFYQLVDQQTQLLPSGRNTFRRNAVQALSGRGLEKASHISLGFDPSYQSLTLHTLSVHRDGHAQDRLRTTAIKVLQRETDLEYRMYDGSKTVDIVLADVRPGDVVEYAYSIRGTNPLLLGKESGGLDMRWGLSVHHLYRRLLVPAGGQELTFRSHLGDFQPQIDTHNGWTEYNWAATDVAPVTKESDTPRWYDPYPYVEWTTFKDWGAVARWAAPLYAVPKDLGSALQREVDRIAAAQPSPELRLAAVLEFVQSNIRYLGIEIGQGSYQPRSPQKVFQNRYGDCKDKVLLAVAMLRALGIKAEPALVNTVRRHTIADALPSPYAFNHVIVKAQIDGTDFWLDPTRQPQKGKLQRLAQARFGSALVVDGQTSALTPMPTTQATVYRRAITMDMDVSNGYDHPSNLTLTTVYDGVSADDMRSTVRHDDLADLQRKYQNFYLRSYPNLAVVKPFTVEDDEVENRLVTVEHYSVPSLVSKNSKETRPAAYLYAPDMKAVLYRPDDTVRAAPYALRYPEDLTVTVHAHLPFAPGVAPSHATVKDPAFEFESAGTVTGQSLTLNYHYRSLADHVAAQKMEPFIANLQKARDEVGYGVWANKPKVQRSAYEKFAYVVFLVGMLFAIPVVIVAVFLPFDAWRSKHRVRQRSTGTLLLIGSSLFWAPGILLVLWALGLLTMFVGSSVLTVAKDAAFGIAVPVMFCGSYWVWRAIWRNRWLRWAQARTAEPQKFVALAKQIGLPYQLPPVSPMPAQIAWLAFIPHFSLMALFIAVAHFLGFHDAFTPGVITYYVVGTAMEWLAPGRQQLANRMVKKARFAEAIPKFQASYDFLSRHPWIDRWRAITLLSVSRTSLRELALTNIAFCLHQLGREQEAVTYYEQTLFQYPDNALAATELARLRSMPVADGHGGLSGTDVVDGLGDFADVAPGRAEAVQV